MNVNHVFVVLVLLGFWLLLTNGDPSSFVVGVFFTPLSIYVSVVLSENTESGAYKSSIKLTRLPNFILFFIIQSFKGVIDTALRGFARNLDIKPECINYPIDSTPARMPMNLFMNVVSLLPCSVSVIREEQGVLVHVSAKTKNTIYELATATQRNRETCFNGGFLQRGGHFNPKRVVTTSFALIAFALFAITSVSRGV